MRKFLRMFLVCLMTMFCGTIMADEVTITGEQLTGIGDSVTVTVGDFSFLTMKNKGGTAPTVNSKSNDARLYAKNTLTIKSSNGNITKLVFNISTQGLKRLAPITASVGTIATQASGDKTVTWTGDAQEITLTVGDNADFGSEGSTKAGQFDFDNVVITTGGGSTITVPTPTITGTTPFTENTEVTISGTPEGGKTYYTTDGSDPTSSSTLYSDPFTLTETTTVKAISYDKDNNASSVASKTFTKVTYTEAANIAAFNALEAGTKNVKLTLTNAQVLGAGNNNYAIKDASGSTLIYQSGLSYTKGQILNGTIVCERADYNGFTEIKSITDNTLTATDGTLTPKTATPEEVIAAGYFADTYKMENVECKVDNGRYYITVGENKIQIYDNFKYSYDITADGKYNLVGVLGAFRDVPYQFWLTEAPEATEEITIGKASDITEFIGLETGKPYELTLENAQVVYAWTSTNGNIQAFVRDETGALCFDFRDDFKTAGTAFVINKMVNGTIIMNNNVYNGLPQASAIAETNTEKLTFTDGSEAQPLKITAAEVSKNLNDLVLLENVTITEKEIENSNGKKVKHYYVDDVEIYNQFHIEAFNDLSTFVGEGKNVKGIAVVYNTTYEIYPIEITSQTPAGTKAYWDISTWSDVNVTSEVTVDGLTYYGEAKSAYADGNNTFTKDDASIKCTGRIKMGGGSTFKTGSYSRVFAFKASKGQNVIVFGTHGSSEGDPRTIYLSQKASDTNRDTETAFASQKYEAGEKLWFEGTVPEDGIVYVWADNNMGIYMISVGYTFEELAETSGIETVSINSIKNNIRYNLAGQRVDENYKGVVIMNGKKYVVK